MVKIDRNSLNCNKLNLLIINKKMYLNNKNSDISKTFSYPSLIYLLGSLFFVFMGIDFVEQQQLHQHNIINIAWAEDINGTKNADNITGTTNQDTIKGLDGNDTIAGK